MKEDLHKYKMIKVSASVLKKEFGFSKLKITFFNLLKFKKSFFLN